MDFLVYFTLSTWERKSEFACVSSEAIQSLIILFAISNPRINNTSVVFI